MSDVTNLPGDDGQALLQAFTGAWQGITRTWFEPGKLGDESPWQGTIAAILGGLYLQYDYTGTLQGEKFVGKAIIGYNAMTQQYEMAWIDSFHQSTGIMHCKGLRTTHGFSVLGSYRAFDNSADWGWRTEFALLDANHLTIRAYNVMPSGAEALGVETIYTRT